MDLRQRSIEDVRSAALRAVHLDPSLFEIESPEFLACALRRAAGLWAPATPRTLVRAVHEALGGLTPNLDDLGQRIEDMLEDLIANGDLIEGRSFEESERARLVFLGAPRFIKRQSGAVILLGVAADNAAVLPAETEGQISYKQHMRLIQPSPGRNLVQELNELGLVQVPVASWSHAPAKMSASAYLSRIDAALDDVGQSGELPGLTILDSSTEVDYYRGRWKLPSAQHSGRFIGRRQQVYGADLWCYVELVNGHPVKLIDLPFQESTSRGCDEAWRLQSAIDFDRKVPERFRVRCEADKCYIDVFAPLPMWLFRRWNSLGLPMIRSRGSLFSFEFESTEIDEEARFVSDMLWWQRGDL